MFGELSPAWQFIALIPLALWALLGFAMDDVHHRRRMNRYVQRRRQRRIKK